MKLIIPRLVKVKFHTRTQWRSRGAVELWLYSFFYLGITWEWVFRATPRPLYVRGLSQCPLYRRSDSSQGRSGRLRKISPSLWFDPRTFQFVASRYTACAILTHTLHPVLNLKLYRTKSSLSHDYVAWFLIRHSEKFTFIFFIIIIIIIIMFMKG